VRTRYEPRRPGSRLAAELERESLMVTGDLNMAQVEWIVQYTIENPKDFLFQLRNPVETLRDISESVMREVVGDMTVTEVLTEKRAEINDQVREGLAEILAEYQSGLHITQVILQDVVPPGRVKAAFDDVNNAQQEKEKTINEARQAYNKAIPLARGDALKKIQEAEGYALDRVNRAKGETARFLAILAEYEKAPDVMKRRLYLEAIGKILPQLQRKVIIDERAKGILPLLELNKGGR
jgi:membrane protease subunit HflK